jgi:hypothetical protein
MTRTLTALAAFTAASVLFTAAAPPAPAEPADDALQAGFAEEDISPKVGGDKPVYLAGFGNDRKATDVHDPLKVRAVVLQHGKTKIALACVDLIGFFNPNVQHVRDQLAGFDYVLVSSTHNHEGPDVLGLWGRRRCSPASIRIISNWSKSRSSRR